MKTKRKNRVHWLVGAERPTIGDCVLPTARQVLSLFLYEHCTLKKTLSASAIEATDSLLAFWDKASIPAQMKKNVRARVLKLHKDWTVLRKSRGRENVASFEAKKRVFGEKLDSLFDVAHHQALDQLAQSRHLRAAEILKVHRFKGKTRHSLNAGANKYSKQDKTRHRMASRRQKKSIQEARARREALNRSERSAVINTTPVTSPIGSPAAIRPEAVPPSPGLSLMVTSSESPPSAAPSCAPAPSATPSLAPRSSSTPLPTGMTCSPPRPCSSSAPSSSVSPSLQDDPDFVPKERVTKKPRPPKKAVKKAFLDMLDRTHTTVRRGAALFLTAQNEAGDEAVVMSKATLHRRRVEHRKCADGDAFREQIQGMGKLTLHWDEKLLPGLADPTRRIGRLPVIVSSGKTEKVLDCPMTRGTSADEAKCVGTAARKYGVIDKVIAIGFDTPSNNTGLHKGCCILLEKDWLCKKVCIVSVG